MNQLTSIARGCAVVSSSAAYPEPRTSQLRRFYNAFIILARAQVSSAASGYLIPGDSEETYTENLFGKNTANRLHVLQCLL